MASTDAENLVALMTASIDQLPFEDGTLPLDDMRRIVARGHSAAVISAAARRDFAGRARQTLLRVLPDRFKYGKADRERLERNVKEQLAYLNNFALEAKFLSQAQIASRARMYAGAVRTTYSETRWSNIDLPTHPGVGTICLTNCQCEWQIDDAAGIARWRRNAADSCDTCRDRESRYASYRFRRRRAETG